MVGLLCHALPSRAVWRPTTLQLTRRHYTPAKEQDTAIYHSTSTNPWFNLAYEDWIFRKTPASQIVLFVYRNSPSVIIGRNQNPWREINLRRLRELNIPFVRRRSGGGTVYHDLGNSNYCVFMPRTQFERRTNALLVSDALNNLDVNTYVNERNDICIDGFKIRSAFKLVNARAYHHGTMLIDAKLQDLKGVLSNEKASNMISKGVESVPSPVRNLREWDSFLDHQSFFEAVSDQFIQVYGGKEKNVHLVKENDELENNDFVLKSYSELKSWDWQWGQTPEFTIHINAELSWASMTFDITSHHGMITECTFTTDTILSEERRAACETVCEALKGEKYEDVTAIQKLAADCREHETRQVYTDLAACLKDSM